MKTITITPEQESIIIEALRGRIDKLFNMADQYKGQVAKDYLDEARRVREALDDFKKQTGN